MLWLQGVLSSVYYLDLSQSLQDTLLQSKSSNSRIWKPNIKLRKILG